MNVATKESVTEEIENGTYHSEIFIITKNNNRYHFGEWSYRITDDTLFGKGLKINLNGEEPFEGKISLDDISHFEAEEVDPFATTGLVLGIAALGVLVFFFILGASLASGFESCNEK